MSDSIQNDGDGLPLNKDLVLKCEETLDKLAGLIDHLNHSSVNLAYHNFENLDLFVTHLNRLINFMVSMHTLLTVELSATKLKIRKEELDT